MSNPRGNPQNLRNGGTNKGGPGRPPGWLKEKCQNIVDRKKLIEFLASVASGEKVDFTVTIDGRIVFIPAKPKDRIAATIELIDRGFGKSIQTLANDKENPLPGVVLLPPQVKGEKGGVFES